MSETNHFSERLREPLNETTRKVRRNLMAASVIGVVITKVGLVPSKIAAFGVEFTSSNQQALMTLLAAAIAYFAISFIVYVYSELTAWQIVISSKQIEELKAEAERKRTSISIGGRDDEREFQEHTRRLYFRSRPTFYLRLSVELAIPLIFAVYSCFSLLYIEIPAKEVPAPTEQEPANKALQPTPQSGAAEL